MGLVDYSDSDSDPDPDTDAGPGPGSGSPPASKRRRLSASPPALPPLPPSFHDLYASTVRPSPVDDPSLHQGRRRLIPHQPGRWPSHLYVEWLPPPPAHDALRRLVAALDAELARGPPWAAAPAAAPAPGAGLHSFLASDLGAPLPLHVSLSRPFVLRTEERAGFLERLAAGVRAAGVAPFALGCAGLAWHRSPGSGRSFLVLRVRSAPHEGASAAAPPTDDGGGGEAAAGVGPRPPPPPAANPELAALLARCNALLADYDQPPLYAPPPAAGGGPGTPAPAAGDAFHISVAWSFAAPTDEVRARTAAVFARPALRDAVLRGARVEVGAVKAKVGNAVTTIPLGGAAGGGGGGGGKRKGLFGV